jgi:hypothetical protein
VFAGSFTLDAAAGICCDGVERAPADVLASLIAKSLVSAQPGVRHDRYRLLETIRLFARARLRSSGESEVVGDRHRDWYLYMLESQPLDRCLLSDELATATAAEVDNLRSALARCEAQGRPDLLRRFVLRAPFGVVAGPGQRADVEQWLEPALAYERTLPKEQWHCHVRARQPELMGSRVDEDSIAFLAWLLPSLAPGDTVTAYAHFLRAVHASGFPARSAEIEASCDEALAHCGDSNPVIAFHAVWFKAISHLYRFQTPQAAELIASLRGSSEWPLVAATAGLIRYLDGHPQDVGGLIDVDHAHALDDTERFARIMAAVALAAVGRRDEAEARLRALVAETRRSARWYHPRALPDCLVGLGAAAGARGDHARAALLFAAVPGLEVSLAELFVLASHHRDLAHAHLGRAEYRQAVVAGRALSVDEAIDGELWPSSP